MDGFQDNPEFQYTSVDDLILSRQAALLKRVLLTVGALTILAILLIVFLPGFSTSGEVLEPFLRNFTIIIAIVLIVQAMDKGYVVPSFFAVTLIALIACPYSAYMEAPGNLQMFSAMFLPIGLAGFLPKRSQFWLVFVVSFALTLATFWAVEEFKGAGIEYRSVVALCLLMTIVALMTDGLSSSYRESIRSTFAQLEEIRTSHAALMAVTADRDKAVSERINAETVSDRRARTEQLALDAARAGIFELNLSQDTVNISEDFLTRSTVSSDVQSPADLLAIMAPESAAMLRQQLQQIHLDQSSVINGDYRLATDDGSPMVWLIAADMQRDSLSGDQSLYGVVVDATDRVIAEDERRALQERITETQRLESLGVLAGGIAHDFNNLLHVMMLNADMAKDSSGQPQREAIDKLLLSAGRASELCTQLLAYSGKGQFTIEQIQLQKLVREMGHLLEVSTPTNTVIHYENDGSEPTIEGDVTQIRQIVMNLITNAGDAIGTDAGTITVSTGTLTIDPESPYPNLMDMLPPGVYGRIAVSDTGSGIATDNLYQIFEPFYTTKTSGRGLGLSAVLGIVRSHKGGLAISSAAGQGTSIEVLLPLSDTKAVTTPEPAQTTSTAKLSGKILFADDETEIRNLARIVLGDYGLEVIEASDGSQAEQLFHKHRHELKLVLLDVMMPGKTGVEVMDIVKAAAPDMPVILSSGFSESDALKSIAENKVTFLKKPYLSRTLRETIISSIMNNEQD